MVKLEIAGITFLVETASKAAFIADTVIANATKINYTYLKPTYKYLWYKEPSISFTITTLDDAIFNSQEEAKAYSESQQVKEVGVEEIYAVPAISPTIIEDPGNDLF